VVESERFEVYRKSGDLGKIIEFTFSKSDVEGCDVREPFKETKNERDCLIEVCDRESKMVGD
jgi:hypothetical protein